MERAPPFSTPLHSMADIAGTAWFHSDYDVPNGFVRRRNELLLGVEVATRRLALAHAEAVSPAAIDLADVA
jgi:hypothetical protein